MSFLITIVVLRLLFAVARAVIRTEPEPERAAPRRTDRVLHPAEYELR